MGHATRFGKQMRNALDEIEWGYSDLAQQAQLPIEVYDPESGADRDAALTELAVRLVLPSKLPEMIKSVEAVLSELKELVALVPPLPTQEKTK